MVSVKMTERAETRSSIRILNDLLIYEFLYIVACLITQKVIYFFI